MQGQAGTEGPTRSLTQTALPLKRGRSDASAPAVPHDVPMVRSAVARKIAVVATMLIVASGCGGGSGSTSSGDAERDARVVLQADLKAGSTGKTAARLTHKFIGLEGVAGTRGDGGQHVW